MVPNGRSDTAFSDSQKPAILSALKKLHPVQINKRLLVLKLKAVDGLGSAQAGKIAGIHATSVNRIVNRYQTEGISAIVGVRHYSEHRCMSREEVEASLAQFQLRHEAGQVTEVRDIHPAY